MGVTTSKMLKCRQAVSVGVVSGGKSNQEFQEISKYRLVVHLGVEWVYPFVQKIVQVRTYSICWCCKW